MEAKHIPEKKLRGTPVDHLPMPNGWAGKPVDILFVCDMNEKFNDVPFQAYPAREGWSNADLCNPFLIKRTTKEIAVFFQKWLFFIFLSDALRTTVDPMDFVDTNEQNQLIITTRALRALIEEWLLRDQFLSYQEQERHASRIGQDLQLICDIMCSWSVTKQSPLDEWSTIYTGMFCQWFDYLFKIVYPKLTPTATLDEWLTSGKKMELPSYFTSKFWGGAFSPGDEILKKEMLGIGWCRNDITRYFSTLPMHGVYFVSLIPPPGSEKERDAAKLRQKHQQCSRAACVAIDCGEDYRTIHVSDTCDCSHVGVANSELIHILEQDKVPLLKVGLEITVVPADSSTDYVAISHVWSDGLGNERANTLPWCQVLRIAAMVSELLSSPSQPTLFWIDTLCCPVSPSTARKRAIRLMRKTYAEATEVLVLESYIQSRAPSVTKLELLATIWCSKWSRRLWTLSERVLAQDRLYFRFKDKTLWLGDIITRLPSMTDIMLKPSKRHGLMLFWEVVDGRSGFQKLIHGRSALLSMMHKSSSSSVAVLLTLLAFRSTSKSSDEPLCIGALLDLDMKKILDADEDARMVAMLSVLPNIPPDILFLPGERLKTDGYRWAPETFLSNPLMWYLGYGNHRGTATLGPEGLTIQYPGWVLGCKRDYEIDANDLFVFDPVGNLYRVGYNDRPKLKGHIRKPTFNPWAQATLPPRCRSDAWLHWPGLIVGADTGEIEGPKNHMEWESVLVLASRTSPGHYCAHIVGTATFMRVDNLKANTSMRGVWDKVRQDCDPGFLLKGDWCLTHTDGNTINTTGGTLIENSNWTVD